jgi:hypothetical protein
MVQSKRLSWTIERAPTIRAPKSWPDIVDRDVEKDRETIRDIVSARRRGKS